jgi:hypothetical protein
MMSKLETSVRVRAARCYSFDRAVYDRAARIRRAIGINTSISIESNVGDSLPFNGDFKALLPGWSFLVQSDLGISATGSVVDSWTDQQGGIVGTSPTGAQKPIVIAGPNGRPAIQSVSGQNTSVAFAFAMAAPAAGTVAHWVYAVFRQDAWTLNSALFGSPGSEFVLRVLQFDSTPKIGQAQTTSVSGTAIGTYGRMIAYWGSLGSDFIRYGANTSTTANVGNVGNTSITLFNQLNALPSRLSLCMFGVRPIAAIPTAPQLAALDAAVTSYYGAGVEI